MERLTVMLVSLGAGNESFYDVISSTLSVQDISGIIPTVFIVAIVETRETNRKVYQQVWATFFDDKKPEPMAKRRGKIGGLSKQMR